MAGFPPARQAGLLWVMIDKNSIYSIGDNVNDISWLAVLVRRRMMIIKRISIIEILMVISTIRMIFN